MEGKQLNAESLSGRQLSVATVVAGLSPAAALAGVSSWPWLVFWCGVGLALIWIALRRVGNGPLFCGTGGAILSILYKVGAVLLAALVLGRAASRLEVTSGGSPRFWLLIIFAVPLLWMGWGKAAPFFRMAEILWLAMAVTLGLILVFGLGRVEWRYVRVPNEDWRASARTACEILAPALFLLPYIYKVEEGKGGKGMVWLSVLGLISAALCLITGGILGRAAKEVPQAFFVAAGLLGKSARCEGLLSVLWLLSDLTLAGLFCRVWGARRWPALAGGLAVLLALIGISDQILQRFCVWGTLLTLAAVLFLPKGKGKIVVKF